MKESDTVTKVHPPRVKLALACHLYTHNIKNCSNKIPEALDLPPRSRRGQTPSGHRNLRERLNSSGADGSWACLKGTQKCPRYL